MKTKKKKLKNLPVPMKFNVAYEKFEPDLEALSGKNQHVRPVAKKSIAWIELIEILFLIILLLIIAVKIFR